MNIDKKALIGFITEIEASRERAKAETRHQSEILKQAKEKQFDTKAIRKVLQRRAMSAGDRDSLDLAVDTYERAMGSLAAAQEAVESGRMTGRQAAEHYGVPRGALAVVTGGPKTGFSSHPPRDPDGVITETGGEHGKAEANDDATPATGGGEARGECQLERQRLNADVGDAGEAGRDANAAEGGERLQPGQRRAAEDANPVRLTSEAPATPSVGAVASPEGERVAPPFLGDDPGEPPEFLRRRVA